MKVLIIHRGSHHALYHIPCQFNILPQIQLLSPPSGALILTLSLFTLQLDINL